MSKPIIKIDNQSFPFLYKQTFINGGISSDFSASSLMGFVVNRIKSVRFETDFADAMSRF
jgi:hypothetical protein